ncbi:hypothetical protein NDU88_007784 [Pleurodeles waltl]|uniref:Uncharacterized protein n=1 Tax=Pleurodeles waltl TaxID=8319 RepID=A0AAV7U4R4_PLEWA|nr:hypothetical protein NDU88_007784 [Pleurodeles waltl]
MTQPDFAKRHSASIATGNLAHGPLDRCIAKPERCSPTSIEESTQRLPCGTLCLKETLVVILTSAVFSIDRRGTAVRKTASAPDEEPPTAILAAGVEVEVAPPPRQQNTAQRITTWVPFPPGGSPEQVR